MSWFEIVGLACAIIAVLIMGGFIGAGLVLGSFMKAFLNSR